MKETKHTQEKGKKKKKKEKERKNGGTNQGVVVQTRGEMIPRKKYVRTTLHNLHTIKR
jgi:hypothetical protein